MNEILPTAEIQTPIILENERVLVAVDPQGAFVRSLEIDRKEVIYEPRQEKPGRGGIPILGQTPGPIKGTPWEHLYPNMPSHGTDRKVLWQVDTANSESVSLHRILGPHEFLFRGTKSIKIKLLPNGLRVTASITNLEAKPRKIGHAFHGYIALNNKPITFDDGRLTNMHPLAPNKAEIIQPGISIVKFSIQGNSYEMRTDPPPVQTVVWSDNPDLYEAIEPWWAKIGSGDTVGGQQTKTYTMDIVKLN